MSKYGLALQKYPQVLFARFELRYLVRIILPIAVVLPMRVSGGVCSVIAAETAAISALPTVVSQAAGNQRALTAAPRPVPHNLSRDVYYRHCTHCHGAGKMRPSPPDHSEYSVQTCLSCHSSDSTPKGADSGANHALGGKPKRIPHSIEEDAFKGCVSCHGAGKTRPFPQNHSKYPAKSCLDCHKPQPTPKAKASTAEKAASREPKSIPHSIEVDAYRECTLCHGSGKLKPFPANHLAYAKETCTACHRPDDPDSRK